MPRRRAGGGPPDPLNPAPATPTEGRGGIGLRPRVTRSSAYNPEKDATLLYRAMYGGVTGLGTDEEAIATILKGKSQTQIEALRRSYRDHFLRDLDEDLRGDLGKKQWARLAPRGRLESGPLDPARPNTIPSPPDAQSPSLLPKEAATRLRSAMHVGKTGLGTDEEEILDVLSGRTAIEIADIMREYRRSYTTDLVSDLKKELHGRARFRAMLALKGRPETVEEALERLNEVWDFERRGAGNSLGRRALDAVSGKGKLFDQNVERANAAYRSALEGRHPTEEQLARVATLIRYAYRDMGMYREAKDQLASAAGVAAACVATGVASAVGGPAVGAGVGALSRTAVKAAIQGKAYDPETAPMDAVVAAVGAGVGGLGGGALVAKKALGATASTATGTSARIGATAVETATNGASQGAAFGAGVTAINPDTWSKGVARGAEEVAKQGVKWGAIGALTGPEAKVVAAGVKGVKPLGQGAAGGVNSGAVYATVVGHDAAPEALVEPEEAEAAVEVPTDSSLIHAPDVVE